MNPIKQTLLKLLALSNLVVSVFFVIAAYSDSCPPSKSLLMTYIGLAFPVFLGGVCFFLLLNVLIQNWKVLPIGLIAIAIAWNPLTHYYPFNTPQEVPKSDVLKILSYNVMGFNYENHSARNPNRVLQYIAKSKADIVCLQEYWVHESSKSLNDKKIRSALSMYPYRSVIHLNKSKNAYNGIAVYSKYPISASKRIQYETKHNGSMVCTIKVKGKKILLINNHLESFKLSSRDKSNYKTFIKGEEIGSESMNGMAGLFLKKIGPAFLLRQKQAEKVSEVIKKAQTPYVIVCGDFNDTPISYTYKTIRGEQLLDAFTKTGKGLGISYNKSFFWFRLDHLLHSPAVESYNCTIDQFKASDHYPLWSYIHLKEPK